MLALLALSALAMLLYHLPHKYIHVPNLLRNFLRYEVSPHRVLERLLPTSKVVAQIHERQRYTKPETQKSHHGGEWDRSTRMFAHDEEVQKEACSEHYGRVESGGEEGGLFPLLALHGVVEAGRVVAGDEPHEHVQEYGGRHESTARRRRQHAQHGDDWKQWTTT